MKFRQILWSTTSLFFLTAGFVHAAVLEAAGDDFGIPATRFLEVEALTILDNDTLDGLNAGEEGATAELLSTVTNGTLSCPTDVALQLCTNGSFEYTPGPAFNGIDSFTYRAVSGTDFSAPATVTLSACEGGPAIFTCWHETPYQAKLSELGYNNVFVESFEGSVWDVARSPVAVQSVLSKGITWTSNHPATNNITTGSGPARTGSWGGYDPEHGFASDTDPTICDVEVVPITCRPHDGLSGEIQLGGNILHGVGGYISGFSNANIAIILDGTPFNVGKIPGPGHHFFGVIDASSPGFSTFEFQELDGKSGQELLIFGDDFIIASSGAAQINNPPVLDPVGDQAVDENALLEFIVTADDPDDGDSWSFSMSTGPAGASFTDNFDGTATFSWRPGFDQAGNYPLTFTVTDNGIPVESDSEMVTITVNDVNRPPVLGFIGDKSVAENSLLSIQLSATDPDGNTMSFAVDTIPSGPLPTGSNFVDHSNGTATFSWTPVIGQAGNYPLKFTVSDNGVPVASDSENITITVTSIIVDLTPPVVSAPANITVAATDASGTAASDAAISAFLTGATATDNVDTTLTITHNAPATLPLGVTTVTFSATDTAGNTGTAQATVTVTDQTKPVISLIGNATLSVEQGSSYNDEGATAVDNVDGNITASIVTSNPVNTAVPGIYTVTYNVSDAALNAADQVTRTVTVSNDVTVPVVTAPANITVAATDAGGTAASDAAISAFLTGATATDNVDTTLTITHNAPVTLPLGVTTVTFSATDTAGNTGTAQATVTVTDQTKPVISLIGNATLSVEQGSSYNDEGATAVDNVDGNITASIVTSNPVNTAVPGIYTVTYNVSDAALNAADQVTRTVTVTALVGSLQFSAAAYSVSEDGLIASITVTRINGSFGTVSVDYADIAGGSATPGSDYVATNGTLTFEEGVVSRTFSIDIIDDTDYEGDESLDLMLSNPSGGASLGSPSLAVLTIAEDDPVPPAGSLQFSAAAYNVSEDGISATITVTRVGGSFGTVGVDYASADMSATAGSDYMAVLGTLTFEEGVVSRIFSIDIIDDADYEGDETLKLVLSNPTGGAGLGSPSLAVLTIAEDDPVPPSGSLQFSTPSYNVTEDGVTASITVTRVGGSFGTVGVDYASADVSATAGSDYMAVLGTLTFEEGVVSRTFSIDIIDDADYEGDETLKLVLSNPTGGAGLGSPSLAVLTIAEDDPVPPAGSLQFSAAAYNVSEDGISATITVTRVGGSFGTVGVDYASADMSATAGSDYMAVLGTLTFEEGVVSRTFSIDIIDDADYEGDETLKLVLSNPTGGAGLGSPSLAVLTIAEDDPVPPAGSLQFSAAAYNVSEDGISATITVTRVGGSFGTVGVDYKSSDGTATAGSDYTAVSDSLSFTDGILSQSFSVTVIDDASYEGDEILTLKLSKPTGGAGLGKPNIATLTVIDNDPSSDTGNDNNNNAGSGGSSSMDLITLLILISMCCINLRSKQYS